MRAESSLAGKLKLGFPAEPTHLEMDLRASCPQAIGAQTNNQGPIGNRYNQLTLAERCQTQTLKEAE